VAVAAAAAAGSGSGGGGDGGSGGGHASRCHNKVAAFLAATVEVATSGGCHCGTVGAPALSSRGSEIPWVMVYVFILDYQC
jgi:hypothetical protein